MLEVIEAVLFIIGMTCIFVLIFIEMLSALLF